YPEPQCPHRAIRLRGTSGRHRSQQYRRPSGPPCSSYRTRRGPPRGRFAIFQLAWSTDDASRVCNIPYRAILSPLRCVEDGVLSASELRLKQWQVRNPSRGYAVAPRRRWSRDSRAPTPPSKSIRKNSSYNLEPLTVYPSADITESTRWRWASSTRWPTISFAAE